MKATSLNGHIDDHPREAILVRADVREGWFVFTYQFEDRVEEYFHNDQGRQVFRVDYSKRKSLSQKIKEWLHAGSDSSPDVR